MAPSILVLIELNRAVRNGLGVSGWLLFQFLPKKSERYRREKAK